MFFWKKKLRAVKPQSSYEATGILRRKVHAAIHEAANAGVSIHKVASIIAELRSDLLLYGSRNQAVASDGSIVTVGRPSSDLVDTIKGTRHEAP